MVTKVSFEFSITNNQAEYGTFIVGLTLAAEMGAENNKLQTDSQMVVLQVKKDAQTKDPFLYDMSHWPKKE